MIEIIEKVKSFLEQISIPFFNDSWLTGIREQFTAVQILADRLVLAQVYQVQRLDTTGAVDASAYRSLIMAAPGAEVARKLLNFNWHQVDEIRQPAVDHRVAWSDEVSNIDMGEKRLRRGHGYVNSLIELKGQPCFGGC